MLFVATPVFANTNCKTVADAVVYHDQLLKTKANEFAARYDDINTPSADASIEVRRDFLSRLDALINTMQQDIDELRWLIGHHCGPVKEEPNAIKSVHDMQSTLIALLVRRMDARALRR
ncbi:MAG: hypothetical protein JO288_15125 [Hyphomicrobiales bacterium]|nr:hypothetical protein [Hyphomicrobiales bacterium]